MFSIGESDSFSVSRRPDAEMHVLQDDGNRQAGTVYDYGTGSNAPHPGDWCLSDESNGQCMLTADGEDIENGDMVSSGGDELAAIQRIDRDDIEPLVRSAAQFAQRPNARIVDQNGRQWVYLTALARNPQGQRYFTDDALRYLRDEGVLQIIESAATFYQLRHQGEDIGFDNALQGVRIFHGIEEPVVSSDIDDADEPEADQETEPIVDISPATLREEDQANQIAVLRDQLTVEGEPLANVEFQDSAEGEPARVLITVTDADRFREYTNDRTAGAERVEALRMTARRFHHDVQVDIVSGEEEYTLQESFSNQVQGLREHLTVDGEQIADVEFTPMQLGRESFVPATITITDRGENFASAFAENTAVGRRRAEALQDLLDEFPADVQVIVRSGEESVTLIDAVSTPTIDGAEALVRSFTGESSPLQESATDAELDDAVAEAIGVPTAVEAREAERASSLASLAEREAELHPAVPEPNEHPEDNDDDVIREERIAQVIDTLREGCNHPDMLGEDVIHIQPRGNDAISISFRGDADHLDEVRSVGDMLNHREHGPWFRQTLAQLPRGTYVYIRGRCIGRMGRNGVLYARERIPTWFGFSHRTEYDERGSILGALRREVDRLVPADSEPASAEPEEDDQTPSK